VLAGVAFGPQSLDRRLGGGYRLASTELLAGAGNRRHPHDRLGRVVRCSQVADGEQMLFRRARQAGPSSSHARRRLARPPRHYWAACRVPDANRVPVGSDGPRVVLVRRLLVAQARTGGSSQERGNKACRRELVRQSRPAPRGIAQLCGRARKKAARRPTASSSGIRRKQALSHQAAS
jgi:hypothetical protein